MGLSMRLNLFYQATPEEVYAAIGSFYRQRGQALADQGDVWFRCALHEQDRGWTLLFMRSEPFPGLRRLQLHISAELHCRGFLVAVHKSLFWGYEFASHGEALDRFVQYPDHLDFGVDWFPGEPCAGDAAILAGQFPGLERDVLERYLVRYPAWEEWRHETDWKRAYQQLVDARNVKGRPEDAFLPFDVLGVLDFLRYLGVGIELTGGWFEFSAPVWRPFWISGQNTKALWKEKHRR